MEAAGGEAHLFGFSSGAVLALLAAAHGLPVRGLALFEPPLDRGPSSSGPDLGAEVAALVEAGRRGDAVTHFQRRIGVPAEMIEALRQSAAWPAMEALAHTLGYDLLLARALPFDRLATIDTPALVLDSTGSDERIRAWARNTALALPQGRALSLDGDWHGAPLDRIAAALTEHLPG